MWRGEGVAVALQVDGGSFNINKTTEVGEQDSGVLLDHLVTSGTCNVMDFPAVGTSSENKMLEKNNMQMVICEPVLVGNQVESCIREDTGVTDEGEALFDRGAQEFRSGLRLELEV